ncbi:MAG: cell wall-binding repeat-containing protein [Intrasporangium sp.]|uniref:cell wall-binding repeat-containing protein n=1 Tax=Intrasporangium sp. TaxID=1925024 RepID=UPI0026473A4D|nr:cell wall-binding repeat-containing protein [Intrasporangium sp.]MDN5797173.1 cell wall-binding repeat-containing protein [Intrasporangium sp.]
MSKTLRATSVVGATLAMAVAFSTAAMASPTDPYQDNSDSMGKQFTIDNNLDNLFRVAGPDRVSTAIKLMHSSTKWFTANGNAKRSNDWVIVARSDVFADALAAGPLADVYDAPILLTKTGSIDSRVLSAITDGGFKHAILVGGTGIFPESARAQLEGAIGAPGTVVRQRGIDRFETATGIAVSVARRAYETNATKRTINVYLATGLNFPDALAAGAAAADNTGVVLLTKDGQMDSFTMDFLVHQRDRIGRWANGIEIHTVGGQAEAAAKSGGVEDVADTNSGSDRYATAAMLFSKFKNPIEKIAVVSGEGFADGVAAGGWVANHDGALLLTQNNKLTPVTKAALATVADTDVDVVVVGGTGSVSRGVSEQIANELYTW